MVENCIVRGLLVAGVPMTATNLFALWQKAENTAMQPTPPEVLGPFFKKGAPNASNLRNPGDPGFPLRVAGKVVNTRGEKVEGARLDIWQADHNGLYDVKGFRYRTKVVTGGAAEYGIDTVMPGHYSDRPAQHIHYMITAPGHKTLITQLYFATDPYFEGNPDKNYHKNGIVGNRELVKPVMLFEGPGAAHANVQFDICLERA
jgi:protocatechuate 3,4-dioxygenase beta subunit